MNRPLKKQYPGLHHNCFPLSAVTVYWSLDPDGDIQIARRGFPIVPNFSMTVDSATGKTLDTGITDLGDISTLPSFTRAMKGYISFSRFKKAHDFYLPQPFCPALFQLGPQPWPTLLLEYLKGNKDETTFEEDCQDARKETKKTVRLTTMKWRCSSCTENKDWKEYIQADTTGQAWFQAYWSNVLAPGDGRRCILCRGASNKENWLKCEVCLETKPRNDFSTSAQRNLANTTQRTLCKVCSNPPCTAQGCATCTN